MQQHDQVVEWEVAENETEIADRSVKDAVFLIRNHGPGDVVVKTWSGLHKHLTSDDITVGAHHTRFVWADHGLTVAAAETEKRASGTAAFCR
jgi:hypothetical protein